MPIVIIYEFCEIYMKMTAVLLGGYFLLAYRKVFIETFC